MIVQRYIFRELLLFYLFSFFTLLAIFVVGMLLQAFRSFEGLGLDSAVKLIPYLALGGAPWVLLIATPPSVTLVYARLAADHEIDAMRLCGIAAGRMVAPAVLLGILLVGAAHELHQYVTPAADYARRKVFQDIFLESLKSPPPGRQTLKIGQYQLSYLDSTGGEMRCPLLQKFNVMTIEAEYSALKGRITVDERGMPHIILSQPLATQFDPKGSVVQASIENEYSVELPLEDIFHSEKRPDSMTLDELFEALASTPDPDRRHWILIVLWTRVSQSLAPFLLVLAAVPIGVVVRHGSRLAGLGAAIPLLIVYLVAHFVFRGIAQNAHASILLATLAPDALLLVLAAFLGIAVFRK